MIKKILLLSTFILILGCKANIESQSEKNQQNNILYSNIYNKFINSGFLQQKREETCKFRLSDPKHLMILAKLVKNKNSYTISCYRGKDMDPIQLSDLNYQRDACREIEGEYDGLAEHIYKEMQGMTYKYIHLGDMSKHRLGNTVYILIKNCHRLDNNKKNNNMKEFCKNSGIQDCKIKSVAYSAYNPESGIFYR